MLNEYRWWDVQYISCPVVLVEFPQNASKIIDVAFGCCWLDARKSYCCHRLSFPENVEPCSRGMRLQRQKNGYKTCLVLYRHSHSDRLEILYYTYSMAMFTDIFQYIALVSPKTLYVCVCVAHLRFGSSDFCPKLYWGELAIPSFVAPLGICSWRASRLALVLWVQRVGIPLFFDFSGVDALDDRDP